MIPNKITDPVFRSYTELLIVMYKH